MKTLWISLTFIFMIGFAQASEVNISKVEVNCPDNRGCSELEEAFSSLRRKFINEQHFIDVLKLFVANEGVKSLNYDLLKIGNAYTLKIQAAQKERILGVSDPNFVGDHEIELPSIIPIKQDEYLDLRKIAATEKLFKEIARDKGFPYAKVETKVKNLRRGVNVSFRIDLKEPIVVEKIQIISGSKFIKEYAEKRLNPYLNDVFDIQGLKSEIEELRKISIQFGYYLIDFDFKYRFLQRRQVALYLNVKNTNNYSFYFKGMTRFDVKNFKKFMADTFTGYKREMGPENMAQVIKERYAKAGYLNTKLKITSEKRKNIHDDNMRYYSISIEEGTRSYIRKVNFNGNSFFTRNELMRIFRREGSEQALSGYYDYNFFKQFRETIREEYLSRGYVSVFVDEPIIQPIANSQDFKLFYRIREGIRAKVNNLDVKGISVKEKTELFELIKNKKGKPFNPIAFKEDLKATLTYLQEQGYYFAKIRNKGSGDIVSYSDDNTSVNILLDIETGKKLFAGEIIIIGNRKTRKKLIKRELAFKSGTLLTRKRLEESQTNLLRLGIFSSAQIKPVSQGTAKTDMLIFVREKDFGLVEVAPGVRSDLGFKFSTSLTYNNIDGMNKRVAFKGTVNKRFNLNSLDDRRRQESSSLVEYDTSVNFSENHIFWSDVDFNASLSKSRKRFFSFDADIQRLSLGFSQPFTDWFKASVRYQLETISQFDATAEREHGHFQIGSITPGVTFDFRDRAVNTSKGAWFNLSCEFANPSFLSQNNDELVVDYYKLINRNRFYVPVGDRVVLAMSTSFGIQENKATETKTDGSTEGYIPNIKVFRLSGADIVRGFEDDEINILTSGEDISEVEVSRRAYMVNLKLEPRYYLTDSTILGVFYDAGRVFVNEFDESALRSAVGLSLKYVTPVGTLDFDYGIKLLRKENDSGTLESPGRLHVSIGFF